MAALTDCGAIAQFVKGQPTGMCGLCASEVALSAAKGSRATQAGMLDLYRDALGHGECAPNGAATVTGLASLLTRHGLTLATQWKYAEPFGQDWLAHLRTYAGVQPIILELANGQALHDAASGEGDEVGLHYHYICVLGKQADGYICNDGDNPEAAAGRFAVYNVGALTDAKVCGLLMIETQAATGAGGVAVWTKTATGAVDGHGHTVGAGFATLLLAKHAQSDGRTGEMYYEAGKSYVLISEAPYVLRWTQAGGVSETQAADVVIDLANQIAHLKATPPTPPAPPTPAPTPPTPAPLTVPEAVSDLTLAIIAAYEKAKASK